MLNVLGLLLLFADAQKFEHCEEVEGDGVIYAIAVVGSCIGEAKT